MNKTVKFSVKLLSDMCCGNGDGNGSDVDACCCFDSFGLPEIPARRFKGLLREKADLLAENGVCGGDDVISLFGGRNGRNARIRIDNLRIKDADKLSQAACKYGCSEISAAYSSKRYNTAVNQDGVTKKGSLRIIETVDKGIEFDGTIFITNFVDADKKIIEYSLKLLRNIGLSKHRGLGEVVCESIEFSDSGEFCCDYENTKDCVAYDFQITLLDDAVFMLNSPMQNPDYIPGASMVGALAKYFGKFDYFTEMFFNDLKLTNAYICDTNYTYRPVPLSMLMKKNAGEKVYNPADGYEKTDSQYVAVGGYVNTDGGIFKGKKVGTGISYHIDKKDHNFYTLNKIEKGQTFRGKIFGSSGAIDAIKSLLEYTNGALNVGASSTAQYGRCLMTVNPCDIPKVSGEGDLIVELLSNTIICDEYGSNSAAAAALADELKKLVNFKDYDIYSKTTVTGGYNSKWGMPKPQYEAFTKGTTVVLKGCGKYDIDKLQFIGLHNSEGCGEILFRKPEAAEMNVEESCDSCNSIDEFNPSAKGLALKIEKNRAVAAIKLDALDKANKAYENFGDTLSNSAAMRILNLYTGLNRSETESILQVYNASLVAFNKNDDLKRLAKRISENFAEIYEKYNDTIGEDEAFNLFLKTFIGRYKEAYQDGRNGGDKVE